MEMKTSEISPFVTGHNSRMVKVTLPKFKDDLCFVVISIVYKFHKIYLRQTKVRDWKGKNSNAFNAHHARS